jgi:hypothetical protein
VVVVEMEMKVEDESEGEGEGEGVQPLTSKHPGRVWRMNGELKGWSSREERVRLSVPFVPKAISG